MLTTDTPAPVDAVLAQCAEALRSGKRAACSELMSQYPQFAAEISSFMTDFDRIEDTFVPLRRLSGSESASAEEATLGESDTMTPAMLAPGSSFGDYELLAEIARGGMGVVYKARQRSLNRIVALKMVLGGDRQTALIRERFLIEARAVARLNHPHIVPIYEVGECERQPYFTMEFFSGGSLKDRLEQLQGNYRSIAALMVTVARAVEHAHRRGILHRDLKPTNVLIDERGEPHVTDFGLAKHIGEESDLTQAGAIVGTPSYMAPEQARAETDLSTAVDVYGLGAMLYELLTGRPPFRGNTPMDTLLAAMSQEPQNPSTLAANLDVDLETICLKCLAKPPLDRYSSADAFADDLDRWLRGEPIRARRATSVERFTKWCRRQPVLAGTLAAGVIAAIILLGLAASLWQNAELRAKAVKDLGHAQGQLAQLDSERKKIEADKSRAEQLADKIRTEVKQLEAAALAAEKKLTDVQTAARHTAYAADMQLAHVAWQTDNSITASELINRYRDPAAGEDVRGFEWRYLNRQLHAAKVSWRSTGAKSGSGLTLGGFAAVVGTAVSPDGRTLATARTGSKIQLWNLADGTLQRTIELKKSNIQGLAFGNVTGVFFEDMGRRVVAVIRKSFDMKQLDRMVAEAVGKKVPFNTAQLRDALEFQSCSVDGGEIRSEPFDAARMASNLFPTFSGGLIIVNEGRMLIVLSMERSPDGKYLALVGSDHNVAQVDMQNPGRSSGGRIIIWDLQAGKVHAQQASPVLITAVAFSPKDDRIAIGTSDGAVGIGKVDLAQPPRVLAGHGGTVYSLRFSPDGKSLASGSMDGLVLLWDAVAAKEVNRLRGHVSAVSRVDFSSDGKTIISAGMDGTIKEWDIATRQGPLVIRGLPLPVVTFAQPNDSEILSVDLKGNLKSFRLADGSPLQASQPKQIQSLNVTLSKSGRYLVWKTDFLGDSIIIRDLLNSKETRCTWKGHLPFQLRISPNEQYLAAADLDKGGLVVWRLEDGKLLASVEKTFKDLGVAAGPAFSSDGRLLAGAHAGGAILWDWQTDQQRVLESDSASTTAVAFSADGRWLATAADEHTEEGTIATIRIWDVKTGKVIRQCRGAGQRVAHLEFSPDGQRLLSVATTSVQRSQLKLWDTVSGREVFSLPLPPALVSTATFSNTGDRIIASLVPFDLGASIAGLGMACNIYVWEAPAR